MRRALLALLLLLPVASARATGGGASPPAAPAAAAATSRVFVSLISGRDRTGDLNAMSMNITNYGLIGNNFTVRTPSMEYPVGTGHEHLVRGGLWVGAVSADTLGEFTGVTTAVVDGIAGDALASATEFSPLGDIITVRSSLRNNQRFSPLAVSERDLIGDYDDTIVKFAQNNRQIHRPLNIEVRQQNYSWSFADLNHMVFFHYTIKNLGAPLQDVYLGLYNELASGAKNSFSNWPPGGAWFSKKEIAWVDSLNLFTERYCLSVPIPNNCQYATTPELVGLKLLGVTPGARRDSVDKAVTLQVWNFAPGNVERDEDIERYALMSAGTKTLLSPLPLICRRAMATRWSCSPWGRFGN